MREGSILNVATVAGEPGSRVEFRDVLLVSNGDKITIGSPTIPEALVIAEVMQHGKGKKVISFKYKAKVRYRRKRGHRQDYTRIAVREITLDGVSRTASAAAEAKPAPRRRTRPAAVEAEAAEPTQAEAAVVAEAPAGRAKAPAKAKAAAKSKTSDEAPAPRARARRQPAGSPEKQD